MHIIDTVIKDKESLRNIEEEMFYDDMIKCVVDVRKNL